MLGYNRSAAPRTPPPLLTSNVNANAKANSKANATATANVNANVALAAARQHIMGRLAATATAGGQNEYQSEFSPSNYFIQSPPSTPSSLYSSNNANIQPHLHHQQPQEHQHYSQQQQQQLKTHMPPT
uniref:Uncharacterized protein n=1 Tax=Bactrocera dorsalis TaxID=27457 RepID=A0A034V809_BACDO